MNLSDRNNDRENKWSGLAFLLTGEGSLRVLGNAPTLIFAKIDDEVSPAWVNPRFSLQKDTRYRFRLLREPRQVTLFRDDEEVARASVPELSAPFLNFGGCSDNTGEPVYFDNIEVRAPADRP